jgi:hypothetical protein
MTFDLIYFTYNNGKETVNGFSVIEHHAWESGRHVASFLTLAFSGVERPASRSGRYISVPGGHEFYKSREPLWTFGKSEMSLVLSEGTPVIQPKCSRFTEIVARGGRKETPKSYITNFCSCC